MKYVLKFLVLFVTSYSSIIAQDYTWFGGTGDWDVAHNWIPKGIPAPGDEVHITKGRSIIDNSTIVIIKNIEISLGASLVIDADGELQCTNGVGDIGILNYGSIDNLGILISSNHSSTHGSSAYGVKNYGLIENKATGSIDISNCDYFGYYNYRHASTLNEGVLNITHCKYLARNYGVWTNEGLFTFSNATPRRLSYNGFANYNQFINTSSGIIRGSDCTYGVAYRDLYLTGRFENLGKIVLFDMDEYAMIMSNDAFNQDGGNIHLRDSRYGLSVGTDSEFTNDGYISSSNQHRFGIKLAGQLENNGRIQVSNGDVGILLQNLHGAAFFDNHGEVECFGNLEDISSLYHDFINHDDGEVLTQSSFVPVGITNHGIFRAHYDGYIDENLGSVINHGIFEDLHGILPGITNHQCVLRPLQGPLVDGVTYPNATNKASFSNSIIALGWYDQLSGGNASGLFFSWNNNLFPNAYGAAADALYMTSKIRSSGLTRTLKVLINDGGGSLKNDVVQVNHHLNDEVKKNTAPKIYPNPFTAELNVTMNGNWKWECRDMNGKVWSEGNAYGKQVLLSDNLIPSGCYLLVIQSESGKKEIHKITKK